MIDYVYALVEKVSRTKFYIGRTIHPERRIKEHRYGARIYKDGDELKYLYASTLDRLGIEWEMEILCECGPDTEHYEDFFVNHYRSEPLQNMKKGDDEPWMGRDYRTVGDFLAARDAALTAQKAATARPKQKRMPDYSGECLTRYAGDYGKDTYESPAVKAIRLRRDLRRIV